MVEVNVDGNGDADLAFGGMVAEDGDEACGRDDNRRWAGHGGREEREAGTGKEQCQPKPPHSLKSVQNRGIDACLFPFPVYLSSRASVDHRSLYQVPGVHPLQAPLWNAFVLQILYISVTLFTFFRTLMSMAGKMSAFPAPVAPN